MSVPVQVLLTDEELDRALSLRDVANECKRQLEAIADLIKESKVSYYVDDVAESIKMLAKSSDVWPIFAKLSDEEVAEIGKLLKTEKLDNPYLYLISEITCNWQATGAPYRLEELLRFFKDVGAVSILLMSLDAVDDMLGLRTIAFKFAPPLRTLKKAEHTYVFVENSLLYPGITGCAIEILIACYGRWPLWFPRLDTSESPSPLGAQLDESGLGRENIMDETVKVLRDTGLWLYVNTVEEYTTTLGLGAYLPQVLLVGAYVQAMRDIERARRAGIDPVKNVLSGRDIFQHVQTSRRWVSFASTVYVATLIVNLTRMPVTVTKRR